MADPLSMGAKFAKVMQQASKEAEAALAAEKAAKQASKLEEALKAKQAPMTTPQGTGLPLMPRSAGMYTPGVEQKDLARMPMVDKARAEGKTPKYTPRMQDLLDSPTARKKVNTLIEKGKDLGMTEWYGTEPLRQVAMDIGMSQKQFDEFLAQMASASQRNPVDQQNKMGSYLWHLSQSGKLPEDAYLLTNKIKRGKQAAPEGTAIELPPGYGSLAQGDIFSRGKQIAAGDIEGALPETAKLGTFFRNLQGNLKPVTVDVNAVRGPVIERGDPRWLTSKLVEKDEEGNILNTYFPRKDVESGKLSLKEAKARPGFWEAAPSGSEYAGFEDLWQRAAKRHGVAPAEAQALGWYGSADVTALKTKPELYIDNLERMIRRTAEQTGQNPRQVMEDVLRGKQYLKKKGGAVHKIKAFDSDEAARKWKDEIAHEINKANGGAIKKMGWKATPAMKMAQGGAPNLGPADDHTMPDSSDSGRMNYEPGYAGGGWAKAGKAIAKAAQEAGLAKPVTAEKDLTTLQDFHTSLGDRVRAEAELARRMMEGFDYKYDKGQRVFTKDSAAKNRAPYEIIERTRVGNQVMREGDNPIGKVLRDEAGKAKRTPYEPGYRVRSQQGDDSSEFIIPASAILGDVEMALGGLARYDDGGTVDKAKLMAEILGRMAKDQGKQEIESLKKPRALTDLANRGIVASTVGAPVDIMNMGLEGIDFLRSKATGKPVENRLASDKPFLGSEHLKDLMTQYGMTTGEERPMMETGLSLVSPAGAVKGAAKTAEAAPKVGRAIEGGLNAATATMARPFTPATVTMEAVAPDLAKYKPRQWQETATRRMTGEGAPVSMETLGGQRTTKRPGQGVYENFEGQLETNPLVAVDVPRAGNLSTNKALRRDISQAGADLAQESVAAHRFLPMATNNIADASAMLIKPQGRSLTNEEVIKIGEQLPGMIVAHNPRLGGVVVMPYDYQKGKVPTEFFDAQDIAKSVLGKKANFTYGKADPVKDRLYIERGDYATEGAGTPSAASTAMRDRLKKAEARAFRAPAQSRSGLPAMRGVPATTAD